MKIRIATRKSQLALWQAEHVKQALQMQHAGLDVDIIGLTTTGDKQLEQPLATIGGKGLFVKELENALLENKADIAVHSMKDVPSDFPPDLCLGLICQRAEPNDAFVSNDFTSINDLPKGAIVGTSSLRRQSQLLALRPDLQVKCLRGNINTRLEKLDANDYHAIILAVAGLSRLDLTARITQVLPIDSFLPAVGQGALGIECRSNDKSVLSYIMALQDESSWHCVMAERAMNKTLGGNCHVPVAAFAKMKNNDIILNGLVGAPDGSQILRYEASAPKEQYQRLGENVAEGLLEQGAGTILQAL